MIILIIGLILFLGTHSVRIYAFDWREGQIRKRGEKVWQGIYSLISLLGFVLIIWGYGEARAETQILWNPPIWTKHLAALLTIPAFILLFTPYIPGTKIKTKIGHPMILGVKLWALAHLISNGALVDIVLFGSFLLWAILDFRASRMRDRAAGTIYIFQGYKRDVIAIIIGLVTWAVFALYLHGLLIGVKPFG